MPSRSNRATSACCAACWARRTTNASLIMMMKRASCGRCSSRDFTTSTRRSTKSSSARSASIRRRIITRRIVARILPSPSRPGLVSDYGGLKDVEARVVDQHALKISRDRGFNYGAQDFLEGALREKFQTDFTHELQEVCKSHNVVVRSAFIRTIVIPENFLQLRRNRQIAEETKLTSEAKKLTAESDAEVERARSMIAQAEAKVHADTERMVA